MAVHLLRRSVLGLLGNVILGGLTRSDTAAPGFDPPLPRPRPGRGPDADGKPVIGPFTRANGATIADHVDAVRTSGFHVTGLGAGLYVADKEATDGLAKVHPQATFRARDGRVFRLAPAILEPEMLGAQGDGIGNDQPAIQAMLDYAHAAGITQVRLGAPTYLLWCPTRTTPNTGLAPDGVPLVVRSTLIVEGRPGGSTLRFRSRTGGDRTGDYQVVDGKVWRGGGIYLVGIADPAARLTIERFEMRRVRMDGGIARTGTHGECTPANGGDGWDVSDKGFRVQDSRIGHILLEDVEITGFRGELAYGGGTGAILSVTTRRCWFHGTNADAYNFDCGQPILDVESRWGEAFQPIEGHGGPGSRFERTTWYDCTTGGSLWGGRIGAVDRQGVLLPGTTYAESARDDPDKVPWIILDDVRAVRCGDDNTPLLLANWIKGTLHTIDTSVYLTPSQTGRLTTMALTIHAVADRRKVDAPVGLSGPAHPDQAGYGGRPVRPADNILLDVSMSRTSNAVRRGFGFRLPVQVDGYFGENVALRVLNGRSAIYPKVNGPAPSMPLLDDTRLEVDGDEGAYMVDVLKDTDLPQPVRFTSTHMLYVTPDPDTARFCRIVPSTRGFADGQRVTIRSALRAPGVLVLTNATGLRLSAGTRSLGKGDSIALRFDRRLDAWVETGRG